MVVVLLTTGTRVGVVLPYGLEARYGVYTYAYPLVCLERGERRVYGFQFRPHDGADLFRSRNIYVNSGVGGDVDHRRT